MKKNGFTLIELIFVIVVLGVLAVTAAPKFMNLKDDSISAVNQATLGALHSSVDLVKAKAIASGTPANGVVDYLGASLKLYDYWPECIPTTQYCQDSNVAEDGQLATYECVEVIEAIMQDISENYTVFANNSTDFICEFRRIEDEQYGFDYRPLGQIMDVVEP